MPLLSVIDSLNNNTSIIYFSNKTISMLDNKIRLKEYLEITKYLIKPLSDIILEYYLIKDIPCVLNYIYCGPRNPNGFDHITTCDDLKRICKDKNILNQEFIDWLSTHDCLKPHYLQINLWT